ncbi:putative short-chain dehydrogenases/reductase [Auricularia subglabra TFB-10046 SS5]|uniref:Putative short-chain dehydrogenases/reductase n=1 Tax=Auricularia subglabra (strain TFB-10046 / SS5) TaxID=717982 RepID=J0WSW0_AURST|nr:putative short-chain dehydrogenases/reductase [Auricularia subglabra TFB-10046 SS5]
MPSYVIAGASRGIGLGFVEHIAATPENTVFALARNPDGAKGLQALAGKPNVHILKADMTDPTSLQAAADAVAAVTGGKLDVLVNNGGIAGESWRTLDDYASPQALIEDFRSVFDTNVLGGILTTNAFLPLLRKGERKKVLSIGSGQGDTTSILEIGQKYSPSYAVTKSAMEMVGVKYAVKYKDEGFTFLTICPGPVKTDMATPPTDPEDQKRAKEVWESFAKIAPPGWKGPMEPVESVRKMLDVLDHTTPADSGKFVSHKGTRGDWFG